MLPTKWCRRWRASIASAANHRAVAPSAYRLPINDEGKLEEAWTTTSTRTATRASKLTTSRDGKLLTVSTAEIGVGVLVDAPQPNQARSQRVWKTEHYDDIDKKLETIHWDAPEQLQRHPGGERSSSREQRQTPTRLQPRKAHGVVLYDLKGRCACGKRGCASN